MCKIFPWVFLLLFTLGKFSTAFAETLVFSYESLKEKILTQHPDIRNGQYDIDIAADRQKLAGYTRYPSLKLDFGGFPYAPYIYMSKESLEADFNQWGPVFRIGLNTWIPIYNFGKTANYEQAALFNKNAQENSLEIVRQDVLMQVKRVYWGYLTFNTVKKYIFDVVSPEFEELVKKNEKKFTKGTLKRNVLEQSRIDNLNLKKEFAALQRQKKTIDGQLNLLIHRNSTDPPLDIEFKVKYLYSLPLTLQPYSYYLSVARNNNPFLKKMFNETMASQYLAAAQKAGIWPDIGFYFNFSYNMIDFVRQPDFAVSVYPDDGWKFTFGFALSWSLNIWDHLANYDLQSKNYLKMLEYKKQADQEIENNIQQAYNDLEYQNTQLNYEKEILTIARRNFIFTKRAQDSDTASSDDVSNTLKKLFRELQSYYSQIQSFNLAIAAFERFLAQDILDYTQAEQIESQNEILLENTEDDS